MANNNSHKTTSPTKYAILGLLATLGFSFAPAALAQSTLYSMKPTDTSTVALEYDNEGWKNIRKLYVTTTIGENQLQPMHVYYVCGADTVMTPTTTSPASAGYSYRDKNPNDLNVIVGRVEPLGDSFTFLV